MSGPTLEQRVAALETQMALLLQAVAEEDADNEPPARTLDGALAGEERSPLDPL